MISPVTHGCARPVRSARVTVADADTLHVRVYVLFPLFGETKVWTRVEK